MPRLRSRLREEHRLSRHQRQTAYWIIVLLSGFATFGLRAAGLGARAAFYVVFSIMVLAVIFVSSSDLWNRRRFRRVFVMFVLFHLLFTAALITWVPFLACAIGFVIEAQIASVLLREYAHGY